MQIKLFLTCLIALFTLSINAQKRIVRVKPKVVDTIRVKKPEKIVKKDVEKKKEEVDEEEVFFVVEDMPKFKGANLSSFRTFVHNNLDYPKIAKENGVSGRVFVQFDIDTIGKVVNVVVVRGVDPSLDKEAVRVVKSSPLWEPGKQRGKPVKVRFTFPIAFQLQ